MLCTHKVDKSHIDWPKSFLMHSLCHNWTCRVWHISPLNGTFEAQVLMQQAFRLGFSVCVWGGSSLSNIVFVSAEALFGRAPFASKSYAELEEKIRSNQSIEVSNQQMRHYFTKGLFHYFNYWRYNLFLTKKKREKMLAFRFFWFCFWNKRCLLMEAHKPVCCWTCQSLLYSVIVSLLTHWLNNVECLLASQTK